jgi:hypothetical protein
VNHGFPTTPSTPVTGPPSLVRPLTGAPSSHLLTLMPSRCICHLGSLTLHHTRTGELETIPFLSVYNASAAHASHRRQQLSCQTLRSPLQQRPHRQSPRPALQLLNQPTPLRPTPLYSPSASTRPMPQFHRKPHSTPPSIHCRPPPQTTIRSLLHLTPRRRPPHHLHSTLNQSRYQPCAEASVWQLSRCLAPSRRSEPAAPNSRSSASPTKQPTS